MRALHNMAEVLVHLGQGIERLGLNSWKLRTLSAIRICRTVALGGHIDGCTDCGHLRISFNSCRNRHCPKCQGTAREKWISAREEDLLPVPYFHVVFTLPSAINRLAMFRPKLIYGTLFKVSWSVIKDFGLDPKHLGARMGMIAVLHTWGQQLGLHPHMHCIVPGGGLSKQGKWKPARGKGKFLFPVKAMSTVFRARYMAALRKAEPGIIDQAIGKQLMKHKWVIYAKRSFYGPKAVIEYLGRYTHRIAISEHRLEKVDEHHVQFSYRDYREQAKKKSMTLEIGEFVRRFALHILPKGFTRIRHYGILSSTCKKRDIKVIREQITEPLAHPEVARKKQAVPFDPMICPKCKKATMVTILEFDDRGPPVIYLERIATQASRKKKRIRA